jgi:hypothetical protein
MIFLSSIISKKKSDNNGSRVKFISSDVIEETKRKLLHDFDLDAIISSNDARIISVNRICGKPDVEVIDECDKKNDDKAKKRKRNNNDSKKQKVHDEVGVSENELVEKSIKSILFLFTPIKNLIN